MSEPRFKIGTTFVTRGKFPQLCTVTDIWRTFDAKGDLVRTRYVATHEFAGQVVTDHDVCETTIARGSPFYSDDPPYTMRDKLREEIANTGDT